MQKIWRKRTNNQKETLAEEEQPKEEMALLGGLSLMGRGEETEREGGGGEGGRLRRDLNPDRWPAASPVRQQKARPCSADCVSRERGGRPLPPFFKTPPGFEPGSLPWPPRLGCLPARQKGMVLLGGLSYAPLCFSRSQGNHTNHVGKGLQALHFIGGLPGLPSLH